MDSRDSLENLQIVDIILKVYPPVLVLFGTIANVICMIIWGQRVRTSIMAIFLLALSIFDTIGLYSQPLWQTIQHWNNGSVRLSGTGCVVMTCFYCMAKTCSGWIVVFVGFHRVCRLCFLDQCVVNRKSALIIVSSIVLLSVALSSHRLWVEEKDQADFKIVQSVCGIDAPELPNIFYMKYRVYGTNHYRFNWDLVSRLITCFFPATLTLTCLIAVQQTVKTLNTDNERTSEVTQRPLTKQKKDSIKIFYFLGFTYLITIVPLTSFKMMVTSLDSSKDVLIYTLLSMLIHFNFAFKLVYYWYTSTLFKQNLSLLFRTAVLIKQIRKINFLRRKSSILLKPLGMGSIHIVDICSDTTESEMSMSPNACQTDPNLEFDFSNCRCSSGYTNASVSESSS